MKNNPNVNVVKEFQYKGYDCMILSPVHLGVNNGYVKIPEGHPLHGKGDGEEEVDNLEVHGGITFGGSWDDEDGPWWIGFDCAHFGDLVPKISYSNGIFRDEEYVTKEIERLVDQLPPL